MHEFQNLNVLFGPAKASNAGGLEVSSLEPTQNAMRLFRCVAIPAKQ